MKMRVNHWRVISCALFCVIACIPAAIAQRNPVFFSSGSWEISDSQKSQIAQLSCAADNDGLFHITLTGHADPNGSAADNLELAEKRCLAVKDILLAQGIPAGNIFIEVIGEKKASVEGDYQQFRRVDIVCAPGTKDGLPADKGLRETGSASSGTGDQMDIQKLWNTIRQPFESFEINPNTNNVITTEQGVLVLFPANAFERQNKSAENVRIDIRVTMNKQDMVLNNLSTAYGQTFLESGGMVEILAWDGNDAAQLAPGKSYLVMVPSTSPNPEMTLFDGTRSGEAGVVRWNERANTNFSIQSAEAFFACSSQREMPCGLICRISSSLSNRYEARRKAKYLLEGLSCTEQLRLEQEYSPEAIQLLTEAQRDQLYRKYQVNNEEDLDRAIRAQIEKSKKSAQSNLSYYTFSSTTFGLVNCDYFPSLKKDLVTMRVDVPEQYERTQFMLAFPRRNVIMQPSYFDGRISFTNVPIGEKAQLIAMRMDDEVISFGMETIVIKPKMNMPALGVTTVSEMSMRLAALNDTQRTDLVLR